MQSLGTKNRPLQVAIIGSGPAGFYTADRLFKSSLVVEACIFEQWPVPFGLVRFGVAPDQQNTKQVTRLFERIAGDPRCRFYGNVRIGHDLAVEELGRYFDVLVFANGAQSHRRMNVPGEDLPGSFSANEFVGWYNGNPDYRDLVPDLSCKAAVVVGNGNVAMDVARMLVRHPDELAKTDITPYALQALRGSAIREVYIVGRRGPAQAVFTHPELLELDESMECQAVVEAAQLRLNPASNKELHEMNAGKRRHVMKVLHDFASAPETEKPRRAHFKFLRSPVAIEGRDRVERVRVEFNALTGNAGAQRAEGTGETEGIDCGLVVRCIGYRGVAVDGVPFDEARGVVTNAHGRIVDGARILPGLYAAGWIKHGPMGLIASGKKDVTSVVAEIRHDVLSLDPCPTPGITAMEALFAERGTRVVSFEGWKRIDAAEIARGEAVGKPREKFTTVEEMLAAADL